MKSSTWLVAPVSAAFVALFSSYALAQQPPAISIFPAELAPGARSLTITSSTLNLANVRPEDLTFTSEGAPIEDVTQLDITEQFQQRLGLSFMLANKCQAKDVRLTVKAGSASASAAFKVVPPTTGIGVFNIDMDGAELNSCTPVVRLMSCEFNLSRITAQDIKIESSSPSSPSVVKVLNASPRSLSFSFPFGIFSAMSGTVVIRTNDGTKTAPFFFATGRKPEGCVAGQVCCRNQCDGSCADCQSGNECK